MNRYFEYSVIFISLFGGFFGLIYHFDFAEKMKKALLKARASMDEQDNKTKMKRRRMLSEFEAKNTLLIWLERQLEYSGLRKKIKGLSPVRFLVFLVLIMALGMVVGILTGGVIKGVLIGVFLVLLVFMIIQLGKAKNLSAVNEELPKFLDFLGNYSLTSGELTSIFSQISRYLDPPLSDVLEEFEVESRISQDTGMALITMADKVEHPQFKQLIRNLEITVRYSADFSTLVSDSRRSMREYLSQGRDRKGMLREAGINMVLLLIMSVVVLVMVNLLIEGAVWTILFETMVGRIALTGMITIFGLFGLQTFKMNK